MQMLENMALLGCCHVHALLSHVESYYSVKRAMFIGVLRIPRAQSCGAFEASPNCSADVTRLIFTCQFGAPWDKPTTIWSSLPLWSLCRSCQGCPWHMHLQVLVWLRSGEKCWLTSVAGAYPPALCRCWARELASFAPAGAWHDGASLVLKDWDSQLQQCPGWSALSSAQLPRCPRHFSLPFSLKCRRRWTHF